MSSKNWTYDDVPEQGGKTVIVTGANTGIGFEAARALVRKGARVILGCRGREKGEAAVAKIVAEQPKGHTDLALLDLADLDSVRRFADSSIRESERLDLLINNAGVMACPESRTVQGFERQFGVNHLGHFALTALLMPHLRKTRQARVVTVSSQAHRTGSIAFDDLDFTKRGYNPMGAYGQSKLANLLFTFELQRRLEASGADTIAVAAHPGWTATDLQRHAWYARWLNPLFAMSAEKGALPTLRAATAPDVKGGEYYGPGGFYEMRGYPKRVSASDSALSLEDAARLWTTSEELTGVRFGDLPTGVP
jgi:NAD(P)-dependent dehydrogenase (short-subunit alcohol dehydrogenase family)